MMVDNIEMNYNNYNQFADSIREHKGLLTGMIILNKLFTVLGFIAYPVLLLYLGWRGLFREAAACIVVPGLAFYALSAFRRWRNSPRPYELYNIRPLISRDGSGDSFPSRHVFSIMLIGGLWCIVYVRIGVCILVCGLGLAVIRVIGGVHFVKDVVWGSIIGLAAAVLTYCVVIFF